MRASGFATILDKLKLSETLRFQASRSAASRSTKSESPLTSFESMSPPKRFPGNGSFLISTLIGGRGKEKLTW